MYKVDLTLNNLQGLICHRTQPNIIHEYSKLTQKKDNNMYILVGKMIILTILTNLNLSLKMKHKTLLQLKPKEQTKT